ncbi:MAG: hypothetical protein ABTQ27_09500 [Amaricoccus sp.]|uniref:hypothetical protein n=1 Tax=Amaricoccus sp. TaxID=1872485 RepID=UPI003314B599
MRFQHLSLDHHRVIVSLRDRSPERNLWEVARIRGVFRLTRFPEIRPVGFDGPFGRRFEGPIPKNLFAGVVTAHRPALLARIQQVVALLRKAPTDAADPDEVTAATERLRKLQAAACGLFPEDFPQL